MRKKRPSAWPDATEYEVATNELKGVRNATVCNGYLRVTDENRPVYLATENCIGNKFNRYISFHKLDTHITSEKQEGKFDIAETNIQIDCDVITQSYQFSDWGVRYFSIRRGDEEYRVKFNLIKTGPGTIGLDDLFDLIAGHISWENLQQKSTIWNRRMKLFGRTKRAYQAFHT